MKSAAPAFAMLLVSMWSGGPPVADAAAPAQFVARHHTEALGVAPGAAEWQAAMEQLETGGCSQATLKAYGKAVYASPAYESLAYANGERVLTAYRGILAREPDGTALAAAVAFLDAGGPWAEWLDTLYDGSEFGVLVPVYCSGGSAGAGSVAALEFAGRSESAESLQTRLDAAAPGDTVLIQPGWVTRLSGTLVVPPGVTLRTAGTPGAAPYARMGRLVRAIAFDGPLVVLRSGAKLANVWVSGERQVVGFSPLAVNVMLEGAGTKVTGIKSETSAGWSNIVAIGTAEGVPCADQLISDSVVTGYAGAHESEPTDGISVACEDTTVQGNDIVDASDVGVVVFGASPAVQRSVVTGNRVIAAGLSAYAALAFLPGATGASFASAAMTANELWTSPTQHFDIGIAVGGAPWVGELEALGSGALVTNNSTANIATNLDAALVVDGMLEATALGNVLLRVAVEVSECPSGNVLADVAGGHASGTLQSSTQASSHACLGHDGALVTKSSTRRPGASVAMLTGSTRSWTTSSASTDPPQTYAAVYRGRICMADEGGACFGADAATDAGSGSLIGYVRLLAAAGQVPLYIGSCYANETGACTSWGLSAAAGMGFVAYAAAAAPGGGPEVALVDVGGLLYHGVSGTAAAYLWPGPPQSTTVTSHVDHAYSRDGTIPAGYTPDGGPVYVLTRSSVGTAPLRRFVNTATGHHFYATTLSPPAGFIEEAVLGHVRAMPGHGDVALYLHGNAATGDYMLTASPTPPSGYELQSLIGYGLGGG